MWLPASAVLQVAPLIWAAWLPAAIDIQIRTLTAMTALSAGIAVGMAVAVGWRRPQLWWTAELAAVPSLLLATVGTVIGIPAVAYLLASGAGAAGMLPVLVPIGVLIVSAVAPLAGAYAGRRIGALVVSTSAS